MNVKELKEGIADGSYVRNPDGSVRPTSLREKLGLSVVRVMPNPNNGGKTAIKFRGIEAQDILRRAGLRKLADKHFKGGKCEGCKNPLQVQGLYKCFCPDGKGGCKNKTEVVNG